MDLALYSVCTVCKIRTVNSDSKTTLCLSKLNGCRFAAEFSSHHTGIIVITIIVVTALEVDMTYEFFAQETRKCLLSEPRCCIFEHVFHIALNGGKLESIECGSTLIDAGLFLLA
jgi:hypothetical protein